MTSKTPSKGYVESWVVTSDSSGKVYIVSMRADKSFACSCPAWKFHPAPKVNCRHIDALLGRAPLVKEARAKVAACVAVSFDGVIVARITQEAADRFRANLERAPVPAMPEPTAEPVAMERFTIRRKFKLTD